MSNEFRFQSKSTKYYVTSTKDDKDGHVITTANGIVSFPPDSILRVVPASGIPGSVYIVGVAGLYVYLEKEIENTRLTWSKQEYAWRIIRTPGPEKDDYIIPADGKDLYWFDEFTVGPYVFVRDGKHIVPPESEWFVIPAH